jgi:hypothetical protein
LDPKDLRRGVLAAICKPGNLLEYLGECFLRKLLAKTMMRFSLLESLARLKAALSGKEGVFYCP